MIVAQLTRTPIFLHLVWTFPDDLKLSSRKFRGRSMFGICVPGRYLRAGAEWLLNGLGFLLKIQDMAPFLQRCEY
jgi:hypothetical protein|tara:strand:- start:1579 stop:1803 length:225 start_codon:yes stop_codon:yes gene_type:complete